MKYNPEPHHRKSIRLKYYDYSTEGYYFITICTQNRKHILSKNVGAGLVPALVEKTHFGNKVEKIYLEMQEKYINIKLHDYVIMPNHLHGVIEINDMQMGAGTRPAPTVSDFIRDFKSLTTLEYLKGVKKGIYQSFDKRIWQRNYYEHIIRNEKEYYKIVEYIKNNPLKWEKINTLKCNITFMKGKNMKDEINNLKDIILKEKAFTDESFVEFEKKFEEIVKKYATDFVKGKREALDGTVFNKGFDNGDFKDIDIQLSDKNKEKFKGLIKRLTFAKEAFTDKQKEELEIDNIIEKGKFSNKMKNLHNKGYNGKGTSIGIFDSYSKVDESKEFKDRKNLISIVIYKNCDGALTYEYEDNDNKKEGSDSFHGKTMASLAAGNNCGVAPKANLYLFKLADDVKREDAREILLKCIKNENIGLDVLIEPEYNEKSEEFQIKLQKIEENCEYVSTGDVWTNCIWGRYSDDGKELVEDAMAREIFEASKDPNNKTEGMEEKLEVMNNYKDKIIIPCTGMTSVQEESENIDKYYGSVCGSSFPTAVLGGLLSLARQKHSELTKKEFFKIMRNTAKLNSNSMKYLDPEALIKEVELKKQNEDKKNTFLPDEIGKATINTSTQEKKKAEREETENMKTEDKINEGENLGDK